MSSALNNWARLFGVQRRTRHVRRLAAVLLNHTKNWSKLNWGRNAREKCEQKAYENYSKEEVEEIREKIRPGIRVLKKVWRIVSIFVKFMHRVFVAIWSIVSGLYTAGAKAGSFFYFTKTTAQIVKLSVTRFVYYTSAKYAYQHSVNLLPEGCSIETVPNITLTTLF